MIPFWLWFGVAVVGAPAGLCAEAGVALAVAVAGWSAGSEV